MSSFSTTKRFIGINSLLMISIFLPYSTAAGEVFDLGGMYTYYYHDGRYADWGDYALQGAHIAIDEINASGILGDDQLRLKAENTIDYHCWPEGAAAKVESLMQKDVLAITGADCSGPAVEIANMAARYEVPVISNGANASVLSSAQDFPWFVRVVTPSEAYEGYLIDVADHFGVKEIGYLYTTDAWGLGARRVITDYAKRRDIRIKKEFGFARDTAYEDIERKVEEIRDAGIRHVVMTGPTPDTVRVFQALHRLDMNKPGNTFYAAEMISADESPEAVNGSLGYFAPMTMLEETAKLGEFRQALETRLGREVDPDSKAFFYGALSYDHILAVAYAIKAIKDGGDSVNRVRLMTHLREMEFEGATGNISLVPGTNDRANMAVQIFNSHGYKADGKTVNFVSVGAVNPQTEELTMNQDAILWPGGTKIAPNQIDDAEMPDLAGVTINTHRISDSLYMLEATRDTAGNIGVLVSDDGVLIVDDQFDELTPQIIAVLEEISEGKLRYILNTHHHADHSDGNAALSRYSNAVVVAHDQTRRRLLGGGSEGLPEITFDESLSIHFGGEVVNLLSLPGGHTDNDTIVLFETSNVVHLGDLMNSGISSFPLADLDAGGNALQILENVGRLLTIVPDGAVVIPGHGALTDKKELYRLYSMLSETIEFVSERKEQGKSLGEIQKEGLPEDYDAWGTGYTNGNSWIEMIYRSIDP
jgi:ABC-type branched-subunit amino acid transport system substrate-binding protein/glyoxylase-like metal-dependent hydrolase (beta-lactamase superfamily II)